MMINYKGTRLLESNRLILRALRVSDAEDVFNNWASDEEVARFMRWNKHTSIDVTKEWLTQCENSLQDLQYYNWGITLKHTNELIGSIGAFISSDESDRYEVGYCISKKYWRNGYATEALKCMMNYLITNIGIKKFICLHAVENSASGSVMKKAGFEYKKEGSFTSFDKTKEFASKVYYLDVECQ